MVSATLLAEPLLHLLFAFEPLRRGIEPASLMDERQLVQTICAFRLLAPEVELSLSTRESPAFRDRVIRLPLTINAFSKTQPGGYAAVVRSWSSLCRMMADVLKPWPQR